MSKNKIILSVGLMAALVGMGYLIITQEPSAKKYVQSDNNSAYPKMSANAPLVGSDVVAKVDGVEIKEDELIGQDLMTFYGIKQKEFEFKIGRLRRYVTQYFIEKKSKELNISPDDFVRNHIIKDQNVMPSDAEIVQFAKEQGLPNFTEIKKNEQALAQITQFLRMRKEFDLVQKEVNKWSKNHKIEYFFSRPTVPIEISTIGSPVWGPTSAPITIVKFGDFECPFCAKSSKAIIELKKKYGDSIKLVYKHLPLPAHTNAMPTALASVCVYNQSPTGFWNFYEIAMNNYDKLSDKFIQSTAKKMKLDMAKFNDCLTNPVTSAQIQQDIELANRLGLESTPVFFINGEVIAGSAPVEAFEEVINYYWRKNNMKFGNKAHQDILDVLNYEDGPILYGFEQKGESFLASKVSEDADQNQQWIIWPLTVKDKYFYDQMKEQAMPVSDFVKGKSAWLVDFDYLGVQTSEKLLTTVPAKFIKSSLIVA